MFSVADDEYELTRTQARDLQEAVADALEARHEFVWTAGEFRRDGSYVVSRRSADSSGNEKVFPDFEAIERLYGRMPESFTATDVERSGISGSRRHMLVRHFAEHPAFDCQITCRNPLTADKETANGSVEVNAD